MQSGSFWAFRHAAEIEDRDWDNVPDRPDFYRVRHVKRSRVDHICDACKNPIKAGEPYDTVAMKMDHEFTFLRVHSVAGCPEDLCHHRQASWHHEPDWHVKKCDECGAVLDDYPVYPVEPPEEVA